MQIYYVNLDRDTARRDGMVGQLGRIGLAGTRVPALTPGDIDPALVNQFCDPRRRLYVTPEELACTLSHHKGWRMMLDANEPHALFLEDDVLVSPRLGEFLSLAPPALADLDVLRVETNLPGVRLGPPESSLGALADLRRIHGLNFGAGGYILTRSGAEYLLGEALRLEVPVDVVLYSPRSPAFAHLRMRQAVPAPVANGPAMIAILGADGPSNLDTARQARIKAVRARGKEARRRRFWSAGWRLEVHNGYLRQRENLRRWINRRFRNITEVDIPLL